MKRNVTLGVLASTIALSSLASAQDFADKGTFLISVDRAFGFTHAVATREPDDPPRIEVTERRSNIGFLGQGDIVSPFSGPRAAFDYFIIDSLSIGGSLAIWSQSGERDVENGPETNLPDRTAFLIAPRVGYALMFSEHVGWWPRGGFSFFTLKEDAGPERSESGFAFNADLPFVFVPVKHAAILVGPSLDVTLGAGGELDTGPITADYSVTYFDLGIYAGIGFWL